MNKTMIAEEFLDTYEGEVLFLAQDLEELVDEIQKCTFTQDTFTILEQKLNDVADVFLSSTYTQHVSPVFKELSAYVAQLESSDFIKFEDAREYLGEIIMDVENYINMYFVDRVFSDVYLFQDSLKSSIDFLKRAYSCDLNAEECREDDGSALDFF